MLFAAGVVAVLAVVVPFLVGTRSDAPIALDLIALLLPVGLGLALLGLLRGARRERRVHRP